MKIFQLFKKTKHPRRHHGECQRCQRTDYLPWATEHGVRFCGQCHEKDCLEYAKLQGWQPVNEAVNAAIRRCANLIDEAGFGQCETGMQDPETGTFECRRLNEGECNCHEFSELAEKVRALQGGAS